MLKVITSKLAFNSPSPLKYFTKRNISSNVWLKFGIKAECCRCAQTEHQVYSNRRSVDINECFVRYVLDWKQKQCKFENCNKSLRVIFAVCVFDATADPPVLNLQLCGSGIGLQRGTGSELRTTGFDGWREGIAAGGWQEASSGVFSPKRIVPLCIALGLPPNCHQLKYTCISGLDCYEFRRRLILASGQVLRAWVTIQDLG